MEVELRFFATFRTAVGSKTIQRTYDDGATVGDVLRAVEDEYPELVGEFLDEDGAIRPQLSILKNGREVVHMAGTETELMDGDRLSMFPPVAGGDGARRNDGDDARRDDGNDDARQNDGDDAQRDDADATQVTRERSFRGISERLALHYLGNLGGERVADDAVEGEGWRATTDAETVHVAGSLELTEVTVAFEGEADAVEDTVEAFAQKAMRAGG